MAGKKQTPKRLEPKEFEALLSRLSAGNRRALAKAITLAESRLECERACARALIEAASDRERTRSLRLGITGAAGAGKSSLINALCLCMRENAHAKIAVLTIDPASAGRGGAILADKTRMLEASPQVFIRPSPARNGTLSQGLYESILLCEQSGCTTVIVETTGSGQADVEIADFVDCLVVVIAPGSGDALQGMKRGVLEVADILVASKHDGEQTAAAARTLAFHSQARELFPGARAQHALLCSTQSRESLERLRTAIEVVFANAQETLAQRRARQRQSCFLREWARLAIQETERKGRRRGKRSLREMLAAVESSPHALPSALALEWFAEGGFKFHRSGGG